MIGIDINDAVILEQQKVLEAALSTNPKTQKALQKLIRKVILEARKSVSDAAENKMKNDPRGAAQAVRTSVYKKILGANINIFSSRKAHGQNSYEPPRKGVSGRGGNRRTRSQRTRQIMGYAPLDRGFILRFLKQGTKDRNIQHLKEIKRADGTSKFKWSSDNGMYGNRGAIKARNWFQGASLTELQSVSHEMQELIDNIINDEFK
jgi:hypothetical protein